jgi:hypothetical protein
VLRRPIDSAQYTSIRYSDRLAEEAIAASIGSVGVNGQSFLRAGGHESCALTAIETAR